jgi:portal protein
VPTLIDRLFGRAQPEKASTGGTGSGVYAYYNDIPLWTAARNPRKLMRQAQQLYHDHPWVHAAELAVSSRAANVAWHLEDEEGEEVTDDSAPEAKAIRDLFEKPQANLPPGIRRIYRRPLWQVTLRHEGLCGSSFWYLDQRSGFTGTPAAFLYINPARMWPQYDKVGNVIGWKLDADDSGEGGVPLELEEVVQFDYDPPDSGAFGIGIVESAGSKAHLSTLVDRHESNVLASGGRLAGIFFPKDEAAATSISTDDWSAFVRDWRNINEDPNAAKRAIIAKHPLDTIATASPPSELQVVEVSKMSRDDITSLWGVPLSQLGVEQPAGLNSGNTKSYDEAVLWQGAIHSRLVPFRETIQFGILDRIAEAGGPRLELVIEEPEFDDDTPMYERAEKAISLPLRNRERRDLLGLEPFGDPMLDEAVWMPLNIVELAMAPDASGNIPVAPPPPTPEPPPVPAVPPPPNPFAAKASIDPLRGLRATVQKRIEPKLRKSIEDALRSQAEAIAQRVRQKGDHIRTRPRDSSAWWSDKAATAALEAVLLPTATEIAGQVGKRAKSMFAPPGKADSFLENVEQAIRQSVGKRIKGINDTTRDAVADVIAQGFDDGLSPAEIGDLIVGATAFDASRAELIARTETALVYNESAIRSYGEFGVTEVQAIDGDEFDETCRERNGQVFSIEDAMNEEDHPNGTLDWAPVVGEPVTKADLMVEAMKAMTEAAARPNPPQVINITTPPINLPPQPAPEVRFAKGAIEVGGTQVDVHVPEQKPRSKRVIRDGDRIVGIEED